MVFPPTSITPAEKPAIHDKLITPTGATLARLNIHSIPMPPHNTTTLPVTGRCHCGAVQLRALVDPSRVFVCHCSDCQVLTGSAYRVVVPALAGSCELTGPVTEYARRADSGAVRLQVFCPTCGTPLLAQSADGQGLATLRVGVLDQRADLAPVAQLWQRSALPWVQGLHDVPGCAQQELLSAR
jgi:hypothetical protein